MELKWEYFSKEQHFGRGSGWALLRGEEAFAWVFDNGAAQYCGFDDAARKGLWQKVSRRLNGLSLEEKKRYLEVLVRMEA
jgi:hypothetical protein